MELRHVSVQCDCEPTVENRYEIDGAVTPAEAVIAAIAEAEDSEPTDLPPLFDTVDPDALNQLFDHRPADSGSSGRTFEFRVQGWQVSVHGDGRVHVCDPGDASLSSD